jgi:hypothetical protein
MHKLERTALQAAVTLGSLIPLAAGGAGMLFGPAMVGIHWAGDLDSHYRYLSGLLFALGLGFLSTLRGIERQGPRFRLLTAIVVIGGVGRFISLIVVGPPGASMLAGLAMELVVTPGLALWQHRVAKRCGVAEVPL